MTRMTGLGLGALFASGCAVCGLPEGSIATIDYSGDSVDECDRTGVLLTLDPGGTAYDYVDLLIGPLGGGEVRTARLTPDASGGTITVLLDPDLQGEEVSFGARGREGDFTTASGSTSLIVEADHPVSGTITLVRCTAVGGPFCEDGVLRWCEDGATRTATCETACTTDGTLCEVPIGGGSGCGAGCGSCPPGCWCPMSVHRAPGCRRASA